MKIRARRRQDLKVEPSKFKAAKYMSKEEKDDVARGTDKRPSHAADREIPNRPAPDDEKKLRSRPRGRVAYNMLHGPHVGTIVGFMVEVLQATGEPLELDTDRGTVIVTLPTKDKPEPGGKK